jgi:Family of unknown function (DUF5996)
VEHRLVVSDSEARTFTMPLEPMSVARFYREFMAGLRGLGIDVQIRTKPVEVAEAIPFESDEKHASYDPRHANLVWRGFLAADRVMKEFQSGFVGKASPVHVFWGSFDLAAARFSGRPAPLHSDSPVPNCPPWVMEEAYSREESSAGWWPSTDPPGPQFYAYTYPEPDGFSAAAVRPADAYYDTRLGEFTPALRGGPHVARSGCGRARILPIDVRGRRRPGRLRSSGTRAGPTTRSTAQTTMEHGHRFRSRSRFSSVGPEPLQGLAPLEAVIE